MKPLTGCSRTNARFNLTRFRRFYYFRASFMKKIRTKTDEIHIDEYGIIHKKVIEGVHISREEVLEAEEAITQLSGKSKCLVLVDATALHTMTPDGAEALKANLDTKRIATAILSDKLGIRILFSYLANRENTAAPIQLFTIKEEAINWLLQFKKN